MSLLKQLLLSVTLVIAGILAGTGLGFGTGVIAKDSTDKALLIAAVGGGLWLGFKMLKK